MRPNGARDEGLLHRWQQMTTKERFFVFLNFVVDALLFLFLLGMIYVAIFRDPMASVFWVPFLLVVSYFRFKQAKRRWAVRPEIRY